MMSFFRRNISLLVAGFLLALFASFSLLSEGYYGGADNISHYLISHYAFKYPSLLLNAWGRPLYTMISAPFAQFGLHGAKLLNVVLGIATAWYAWRIATILRMPAAIVAFVFICFTPLYFVMMPTALTEILFGFIFLWGVYCFLKEKFIFSAILFSFLPFARSEGYVLLPMLLVAFLWAKQFKALPFLATGICIFSVAGGLYYHDLFWLINRFPYPVNYTHPIYNQAGSLFHYLQRRDLIIGLPLEILFVAGLAGMVRDFFSREKVTRKHAVQLGLLIFLPFACYFAFHSFLYSRAMGGSVGLERVMAAVLPLAALVSLRGFGDLLLLLRPMRVIQVTLGVLMTIAVIATAFLTFPAPFPLSPEEKTIRHATSWLSGSPYKNRLLFYTDNNVPFYAKLDPYRKHPAECFLFGDSKYLDTIPAGSVLIWDAHFGANESKIPIDSLLRNKRQKVIHYIRPEQPWITFAGGWYDCYITRTMEQGESADNYAIRDSLQETLDEKSSCKSLYMNTFENPGDCWDPAFLSVDTVHRGKYSLRMDSRTEFSPGFTQHVSVLPADGDKYQLRVSLYVNLPIVETGKNTLVVISVEHNNKPYSYNAQRLNTQKSRPASWDRITLTAEVPEFISPKDLLKVYVWNPEKQVFYLDDFRLDLEHNVGRAK